MEEEFDNILQDPDTLSMDTHTEHEDQDEYPRAESSHASSSPTHLLTQDIVTEQLMSLKSDRSLLEESRKAYDRLSSTPSVFGQLKFLEECLPTRGRFPSAAAEKAWTRFHAKCLEKYKEVAAEMHLSPGDAFRLCLKVFEHLVHKNYTRTDSTQPFCSHTDTHDITDNDRNVLHYIGGSMLRSITAKIIKSCKQTDKAEVFLDILQCFYSDAPSTSSIQSLTQMRDRGGLTHVKPSVVDLLGILETQFLKLCSGQKRSGDMFLRDCLASSKLTSCFYKICYASDANDEDKEFVLENVLKLFFKIRIHHKCRKYMDDYRNKQQLSKREASLRKKLKTASNKKT